MALQDLGVSSPTGAAVGVDISAALAAVARCHKGPSAPASPQAGMLWLDDNTPSASVWTLAQYSGVAWITIGLLDTVAGTFTAASSAIGAALLRAADAGAARAAIAASPLAQAGAGVGQVVSISTTVGSAAVLPAGGIWEWFVVARNAAGAVVGTDAGIAAGGATIASIAGEGYFGRAKRIA
jgi:hypothetical protein